MSTQKKSIFYLQVTPGFEQLAWQEILFKKDVLCQTNEEEEILRSPVLEDYSGGFELELPDNVGYRLARTLKIPNRVLLRLISFKCRDLPKLYNKIKKQDWRFFNAGQDFDFHVSSQNSRLFDERKIKKTLVDALRASFEAYPPKKNHQENINRFPNWSFFCRFEQDLCVLSLDLCGERLSKRGYKKSSGRAPLRENLAAALWFYMTYDLPELPQTVVDPFAGSGTLLFEAALFTRPNTFRTFISDLYSDSDSPIATAYPHPELIACEYNKEQFQCLQNNAEATGVSIRALNDNNEQVYKRQHIGTHIVITNPPYQQRIKAPLSFWQLPQHAERLGILLPPDQQPTFASHHLLRKLNFKHGGKKVTFHVLEKSLCLK